MGRTHAMGNRYHVETLPNGLVAIQDRRNGLRGLFKPDGTPHGLDLSYSMSRTVAAQIIRGSK